MPFYKVEHRTLLDALKMLQPGIELPSAYQLENALLDSAFAKSIAAMEADLTGEVVTVVTDGWTDINGLAVVNYVVAAGKKTYFLESVYTGSQSHDTEFLVRDARRVISKYKFLNVGAIVTDNTTANKAMWEELQPDFPNVFFHGCVCHALHLLVKDRVAHIPWLDKLQAESKRLVVFFKTNHKLWFRFRQLMKANNLKMLALPDDTRWGSLLACLISILEAEDVLFSVVSGRKFMEAKTKKKRQARQLVFNLVTASDFVSNLKHAIALLKLVAKPMKQFVKNETPVSDVFKLFLDLPTSIDTCGLPARDVKVVKGLVKERFDFIYGDAHGVGFLLDPRYRGLGMDSTTRANVETLLAQ
ncbi:hypothetical protein PR003_g23818 [Phytophthora rubi]|uniref:DUF659 domain-containing protein n=1 Tax=Phytophthora rubi TaxID=129364 RepID=A0A6A3ITC0_9STRA|nr:hypothetical protein PR002_g23188 [Phytophthora rubi]KAE8986081.1 hypothetical protein PR001_g22697 [Phytophthora rubi]KAE9296193.1 hypothetical protein PR003_g23818 [Phytophthora rubi]